ncbi:unnamed protein product [Allacma fusca]|uniref:Uncharacterized protein n=1 Tax=Allacma fusca TaxID=39272 RepID=A0A8J2PA80_9HEXA|nr:unnamed protein product [Allacma fusca]
MTVLSTRVVSRSLSSVNMNGILILTCFILISSAGVLSIPQVDSLGVAIPQLPRDMNSPNREETSTDTVEECPAVGTEPTTDEIKEDTLASASNAITTTESTLETTTTKKTTQAPGLGIFGNWIPG